MEHHNNYNVLLRHSMLFNQYVVDQYAEIKLGRLAFILIRRNQAKLRSKTYVHLQDALHSNENSNDIGQLVIFPS